MKRRIVLNKGRDLPMLIYIWKWKIVTTAAIYHKFYKGLHERTPYNRLLRLRHHGIVQIRRDLEGNQPVWMLGKKGFDIVRPYLPSLKEEGFRSENIIHDLYCSAFQQGDFFLEQPENIRMISEQQLRRYNTEELPPWVPSPDLHRPDGYWFIGSGENSLVVSLELEYSRKSTAKIERLADFYSDFETNFRVLWVLESKGLMNRIQFNMDKASTGSNIHNLILLKDFLKNGWLSKIINGPERGQTVRQFFYEKACVNPVKTPCTCIANSLLDSWLCYRNDSKRTSALLLKNAATV